MNQLHGGAKGFSTRVWDVEGVGDDWVEFTLESPNGDQGFPGKVQVSALFELVAGGAQVTYRATTDAPTVVNLTTHPYFNLDGEDSGDTDFHQLRIPASAYTPNHDDGIPTGEIRDVTDSAADFRLGRVLGPARERALEEGITRNGGYDHNFVIDGDGPAQALPFHRRERADAACCAATPRRCRSTPGSTSTGPPPAPPVCRTCGGPAWRSSRRASPTPRTTTTSPAPCCGPARSTSPPPSGWSADPATLASGR